MHFVYGKISASALLILTSLYKELPHPLILAFICMGNLPEYKGLITVFVFILFLFYCLNFAVTLITEYTILFPSVCLSTHV